MSIDPSVRKGIITEPAFPLPYSSDPSVYIQDDFFPPGFFLKQEEPCESRRQSSSSSNKLLSPYHFATSSSVSPASSISSSPTFSSSSFPLTDPFAATALSAEFPAVDSSSSSSFEAPSMTPTSSTFSNLHTYTAESPLSSSRSQPPQPYHLPFQFSAPQFSAPNMLAQHSAVANSPTSWDSNFQQLLGQPGVHSGLSSSSARASPHFSPAIANSKLHRRSKSATLSKQQSLPTPVQTPVQSSFFTTPFQGYDHLSSQDSGSGQAEAEMAVMRRAVIEQQQQQQFQQQQHRPSDYSLAHSSSSMSRNSPITPQTSFDDIHESKAALSHGEDRKPDIDQWMDDYLRLDDLSPSDYGNQSNGLPVGVPKFNRTLSDMYQDELYNPMMVSGPQQVSKQTPATHSHQAYHTVIADRLQAANLGHMSAAAHSQAPATPQKQKFNTAAALQQSSHLAAGMKMEQNTGESKTISPKDAMLDYHESDDATVPPMFPSSHDDFNVGDTLSLRRESSSSFRHPQQNFSPMEPGPQQYSTMQYPFQLAQSQHHHVPSQSPHHLAHQPQPQAVSHGIPFMHSTTAAAATSEPTISRPENIGAHEGTYTCTYHGCTMRFDTPARLQKHKREAHRHNTPGTGHLSGTTQAGPHRCERINPATGKPCNAVFSRPYDLTRHEDTKHNARKQKVRCHLCTDVVKTFSRNDALTRHMRVVHPEVDWPGKQRRRSRGE